MAEGDRTDTNIGAAKLPVDDVAPPGLAALFAAAEAKAKDAMEWYEWSQRRKKVGARRTRGTAIFLGAVTTIIPSVIALLPDKLSWWFLHEFAPVRLNPLATIAGVLGATMILLDKFYGFSSGWMRYVATFQEIQGNLEDFRIGWHKQMLRLNANKPPTSEQILAVYDYLGAFLKSVNTSVQNETAAWITEFKGALSDIDKAVDAQKTQAASLGRPAAHGGLNVVVQDYASLDDHSWTLQLDNREPEPRTGQSLAAIPQLEPGLYRLRIAGKRDNKPVAAEFVVTIKAGEVAEQKIEKLG